MIPTNISKFDRFITFIFADYEAANALKFRTWDKRAQQFLQVSLLTQFHQDFILCTVTHSKTPENF